MNTTPETLVRIRFTDCDPLGHLNNARYLDYFLNTREDQIRQEYGLDFFTVATQEGVSWVVGQNQVSYFKPAKYGDKVCIQSQLFYFNEKMLRVEMKMWDEGKTHIKSLLWATLLHINVKTGKVEQHAQKYMELFGKVVKPVEDNTFEEGVKRTIRENKLLAATA